MKVLNSVTVITALPISSFETSKVGSSFEVVRPLKFS
ncbi:MAG: hypothetical protein IJX17_03570 [Clostridia bacterium]|nr:hypothetical protein [Clostridia bacterium]